MLQSKLRRLRKSAGPLVSEGLKILSRSRPTKNERKRNKRHQVISLILAHYINLHLSYVNARMLRDWLATNPIHATLVHFPEKKAAPYGVHNEKELTDVLKTFRFKLIINLPLRIRFMSTVSIGRFSSLRRTIHCIIQHQRMSILRK